MDGAEVVVVRANYLVYDKIHPNLLRRADGLRGCFLGLQSMVYVLRCTGVRQCLSHVKRVGDWRARREVAPTYGWREG